MKSSLYLTLSKIENGITNLIAVGLGVDAIRHIYSGSEGDYQIAAAEAIALVSIGSYRYFKRKTQKNVQRLNQLANRNLARVDQLTTHMNRTFDDITQNLDGDDI